MSDTLIVAPEAAGERLDSYLAAHLSDVSRSLAARLVREGQIRVNGQMVKPSHHVSAGERIDAVVVRPPALSAAPEDIPLNIVWQDDELAVIDKPAGLVVHPAPGHASGTLANALAARYPAGRDIGGEERPGIVHRLDKGTSGLMVVALSPQAYASLQNQIASHEAGRRYLALVSGQLQPTSGTIEAPIGRDLRDRKRMAVHGAAARQARTSYRTLERVGGYSLVEARLHTGRTHQIRVHVAALGHPLAGDVTYGGHTLPGLDRQFLHAYRLSLRHPTTEEELDFESPLPPDLTTVLQQLRTGSE